MVIRATATLPAPCKNETLNSEERNEEDGGTVRQSALVSRRARINGEKMMALGKEINNDKVLCWKKVPSNPYSCSCSTATKRCESKQLFCQSWQTCRVSENAPWWVFGDINILSHTHKKHFTTIKLNALNPVSMFPPESIWNCYKFWRQYKHPTMELRVLVNKSTFVPWCN